MTLLFRLKDLDVHDLDSFRLGTSANWPQISRIDALGGQFHVRAGRFSADGVVVVQVSTLGHEVHFDELPYVTISIPLTSTITSTGHRTAAGADRHLAFYQDGSPARFLCGPGYSGYHVNYDKLVFRRFLEAYFGTAMPTVFRHPQPFPLSRVKVIRYEIQQLEAELSHRRDERFSERMRRVVADRMMRATLSTPLGAYAEAVAAAAKHGAAANAALQKAVDYIRADYTWAMTSQDIAQAAGANLRSLQLAFRTRLGTSIWQYLTMVRLEAARARLMDPGAPTSVTAAALESGFTHLGEFGTQYRARFGEPPVSTLRQAGGQPPGS